MTRINGAADAATSSSPDSSVRAARIRELNDRLRQTFVGGRIVMTSSVAALGHKTVARVLLRVRGFHAFTPDNDPHGEHDFGAIDVNGKCFFWKIDYYDSSMTMGSADPADPAQTTRVLTIMLTSEY